jgi:hypothetical protein
MIYVKQYDTFKDIVTSTSSYGWESLKHKKYIRYLLGQNGLDEVNVVDVAVSSNVDSLKELINLGIRHLLAQRGKDVSHLADTHEPSGVLVEHLESPDVILGLTERLETAWSVDDLGEGLVVDCVSADGGGGFMLVEV